MAYFVFGSPASRGELSAGSRIVAVDGVPVADLDEFIAQVSRRQQKTSVRLTTRGWNEAEGVVTLKPDPEFWPSWEIVHNGDWHRVEVGASH